MSDAVVIGSGLGGLLSGVILSRAGYHVTVLEKAAQPGGCLQSFTREGLRFETGFHSVAGLEENGPLERIFRPLGLMDLPWERVEETDELILDGVSHRLTELPFPLGNALRLSSAEGDVTAEEYDLVMQPFLKGSWRLPAANLIVDRLAAQLNGPLRTGCAVTAIEPGRVRCEDGSAYEGIIVSDIHPRLTFGMFEGHVRSSYLQRIQKLEDGPGIFTVYCKLRPETIHYQPWNTNYDGDLMLHYGNPDGQGFARSVDLLTFCRDRNPDRTALAESLIRRVPAWPMPSKNTGPARRKAGSATPARPAERPSASGRKTPCAMSIPGRPCPGSGSPARTAACTASWASRKPPFSPAGKSSANPP